MDALFIYFGKMILTSAVMFAYYHLVLKDKTFHHYNRFYLLAIVAVSLLLPLLKISYFTLEVNGDIYLVLNKLQNYNSTKTLNNDFFYFNLITVGGGLVSVVLLARLLFGLLKISKFKHQFKKEKIDGISFYQTNLENAPFSFFKNLFWKNSILLNSDLGRQILKHEMVHIEQKHSVDKMMMELVTGLLWFNPVFWFIKKEINLIHEYLADKKAVKHMDTKAFAQMLLASHFSGNVIPATSPFLNSNLKKRLKMLQKSNTRFGYMRRIMALPLVFAIAFIYLVNAKNKEIIETNKVIEATLVELKTDTVKLKPSVEDALELNQQKLKSAAERIQEDTDKMNALAEQSKTKAEELAKIKKEKGIDNPEFKAKSKEIEDLGNKIDKIANSDKYRQNWKMLNLNAAEMQKQFNNPELWKNFELSREELNKLKEYFNSPENRAKFSDPERIKEMSQMFDSEEWKKAMERFQEFSYQTPRSPMPLVRVSPGTSVDRAREMAEKAVVQAEKARAEAEKTAKNRKAYSKNQRDLAKKKAKLAAEKAELARQQAELLKKEAELRKQDPNDQNNPWIIGVGAHTPPDGPVVYRGTSTFVPKAVAKGSAGNSDLVLIGTPDGKNVAHNFGNLDQKALKYYIDDKEVSQADLDKLSPKDIKSVHVLKPKLTSAKKYSEIKVYTKD